MCGSPLDLDDLCACLETVVPVELLGMRLLREQPHLIGATPVVPRPTLVEAITEIVDYTGRCAAAARQLASLTPIPLLTASVLDFGL